MNGLRVMLVDDDAALREAVEDSFLIAGFEVDTFADGQAALRRIDTDYPGVIVTDIRMPHTDGHAVLQATHERDPDLPVILLTGHGDIEMAVAALKQGAFDFIAKPFATEHLIASARRAAETRRLVLENRALRRAAQEAGERSPLLGDAPTMVRLREIIAQIAHVDVDVLLEGETGTGKELVAQLLHRRSHRRTRPFITVDFAVLPEAVADDMLFGSRTARGCIAEADRGTLFLDNIDSIPQPLQGRLLRVVEERALPGNGGAGRQLDLRIIGATRGNMAQAVAEGRFRADLLYRLETVRLRIPPLRERREDIGLLFASFLAEAARLHDRPLPNPDAAVQARLATDDWAGNVRELQNYATRVVLGLHGGTDVGADRPLAQQMDVFEKNVIEAALRRHSGDVSTCATSLGLPRRSFYARLQRLGIEPAAFRGRG